MNYTERNMLKDRLAGIGLMLIFVIAFLEISIDCLSGNMGMTLVGKMPTILNVISGLFLLIGIVCLILAYRKENYWRAGFGIEIIVLSFATLFLMHSFVDLPVQFNQIKWKTVIPIAFTVYYVLKAIYVIIKANKKR